MIEKKSKCLVILILRRFRGEPVEGFMGGGQSRDIFRGGPVKKNTLYEVTHQSDLEVKPAPNSVRQRSLILL